MNSNSVEIGIVGLGGFGYFLLREWSKSDNYRVVAASDQNPARIPASAGELHFYREYTQLLDDPEVQIVSIATPPSTHLPIALAAIEKGKNVLIEKPLALSVSDGKTIQEAARKAGVVATVNFMLRFDPLVEGLRRIVAADVFGKPRRVDLRNYATQDTVPPDHWFWDRDVSGGITIEHGVHFFDMSRWILNAEASEATGLSAWRNEKQEDRVFAAVRFDNDVIGTYWHSFSRPLPLETTSFHMAFDLAEIQVSGWIPLSATFFGWTDEKGVAVLRESLPGLDLNVDEMTPFETISSDLTYKVSVSVKGTTQLESPKVEVYGNLLRAMMDDMVAAVHDRNHKLRVTLEDGISAVAIAEAATRASREGSMCHIG